MRRFKQIALFFWQLPQNLLGLLLMKIYKPVRMYTLDNGVEIHFSNNFRGGISLGKYSIVNICHYRRTLDEALKRDTVRHEAIGHAKQSRMLGWLYLLVIGLPSITWCALHKLPCIYLKWDYHVFYTEKWADKLAGVKR